MQDVQIIAHLKRLLWSYITWFLIAVFANVVALLGNGYGITYFPMTLSFLG